MSKTETDYNRFLAPLVKEYVEGRMNDDPRQCRCVTWMCGHPSAGQKAGTAHHPACSRGKMLRATGRGE